VYWLRQPSSNRDHHRFVGQWRATRLMGNHIACADRVIAQADVRSLRKLSNMAGLMAMSFFISGRRGGNVNDGSDSNPT